MISMSERAAGTGRATVELVVAALRQDVVEGLQQEVGKELQTAMKGLLKSFSPTTPVARSSPRWGARSKPSLI